MIHKCNCKHEEQDKLHGKTNRVYNEVPCAKQGTKKYRCTVCHNEMEK